MNKQVALVFLEHTVTKSTQLQASCHTMTAPSIISGQRKAKQTRRELGAAKQHLKEMKINLCFSKSFFFFESPNRWRG